ncbi:hypothetical protein [Dialister sp.]|uniref:hypothetical protein n=1 Tax=Dialister sp. TaxID=1955814 RepID=UPI003EFE4124
MREEIPAGRISSHFPKRKGAGLRGILLLRLLSGGGKPGLLPEVMKTDREEQRIPLGQKPP